MKERQYIRDKAAAIKVTPFTPRSGVTIHTTDSEAAAASSGSPGWFLQLCTIHPNGSVRCHIAILFLCSAQIEQEELESLVRCLPAVDTLKGFKMHPLDFEKVSLRSSRCTFSSFHGWESGSEFYRLSTKTTVHVYLLVYNSIYTVPCVCPSSYKCWVHKLAEPYRTSEINVAQQWELRSTCTCT